MIKPTVHNLVLLRGELSSLPEIRLLDSGARLALLQVRVRDDGRHATSVPVALWDPPDTVEAFGEGDEVTVVGRVERRFFRTGDGRTASRVEVVASTVVSTRDRRRSGAVLRRARQALDPPGG